MKTRGGSAARSISLVSAKRTCIETAEFLPVAGPGTGTVLEALEAEELVGGVIVLVGRREREEDGLGADLAEDEADGYGGAHAHAQRLLVVDFLENLLGEGEAGMLAGNFVSLRTAIAWIDLDRHAARAIGLQMRGDLRDDLVGTLAGNQAAGDLGVRFAGDHRLRARPLIAAPQPVDLERGTQPHAFEQSPAGLPGFAGRADALKIAGAVERHGVDGLADRDRRLADAVIEAGDGDASVRVVQRGHERGQRLRRVGDGAAMAAGMQVLAGAAHREFERGDAAT